jgi:hypothetical protein
MNRKIACLIVAVWLIPIGVAQTAANETNTGKKTFQDFLDAYKGTHQEIISKLEQAKKNAAEIIKLLQEYNKNEKLMSQSFGKPEQYQKYQELRDRAAESLFESYGEAIAASGMAMLDEKASQKKIQAVLDDTISVYKNTLGCFDAGKYSGGKTCEEFRKCSQYGSHGGDMYYYELSDDLELKEVDVSEDDSRWLDLKDGEGKGFEKGFTVRLKDFYFYCRLLAMSADPFTPQDIGKAPELGSRFIEGFYGYAFASSFRKICIDSKPSEEKVFSLLKLVDEYPDVWILKKYNDEYKKWQAECKKAAQELCKDTYVIKDRVIITYETVGCALRDVTNEDVENDIKWMSTEAEKLKHSTLLDSVNICQQAHDNNFFWNYKKPALSGKCKEDMGKKKGLSR